LALRSDTAADGKAFDALDGFAPVKGRQRPVLTALDPRSVERLGVTPMALPEGLLDAIALRAGSVVPAMAEQTRL
jgi:hypothetical protein